MQKLELQKECSTYLPPKLKENQNTLFSISNQTKNFELRGAFFTRSHQITQTLYDLHKKKQLNFYDDFIIYSKNCIKIYSIYTETPIYQQQFQQQQQKDDITQVLQSTAQSQSQQLQNNQNIIEVKQQPNPRTIKPINMIQQLQIQIEGKLIQMKPFMHENKQYLLLVLDPGRLSVCEVDTVNKCLKTQSIHQFVNNQFMPRIEFKDLPSSINSSSRDILKVDPNNNVAGISIFQKLFILLISSSVLPQDKELKNCALSFKCDRSDSMYFHQKIFGPTLYLDLKTDLGVSNIVDYEFSQNHFNQQFQDQKIFFISRIVEPENIQTNLPQQQNQTQQTLNPMITVSGVYTKLYCLQFNWLLMKKGGPSLAKLMEENSGIRVRTISQPNMQIPQQQLNQFQFQQMHQAKLVDENKQQQQQQNMQIPQFQNKNLMYQSKPQAKIIEDNIQQQNIEMQMQQQQQISQFQQQQLLLPKDCFKVLCLEHYSVLIFSKYFIFSIDQSPKCHHIANCLDTKQNQLEDFLKFENSNIKVFENEIKLTGGGIKDAKIEMIDSVRIALCLNKNFYILYIYYQQFENFWYVSDLKLVTQKFQVPQHLQSLCFLSCDNYFDQSDDQLQENQNNNDSTNFIFLGNKYLESNFCLIEKDTGSNNKNNNLQKQVKTNTNNSNNEDKFFKLNNYELKVIVRFENFNSILDIAGGVDNFYQSVGNERNSKLIHCYNEIQMTQILELEKRFQQLLNIMNKDSFIQNTTSIFNLDNKELVISQENNGCTVPLLFDGKAFAFQQLFQQLQPQLQQQQQMQQQQQQLQSQLLFPTQQQQININNQNNFISPLQQLQGLAPNIQTNSSSSVCGGQSNYFIQNQSTILLQYGTIVYFQQTGNRIKELRVIVQVCKNAIRVIEHMNQSNKSDKEINEDILHAVLIQNVLLLKCSKYCYQLILTFDEDKKQLNFSSFQNFICQYSTKIAHFNSFEFPLSKKQQSANLHQQQQQQSYFNISNNAPSYLAVLYEEEDHFEIFSPMYLTATAEFIGWQTVFKASSLRQGLPFINNELKIGEEEQAEGEEKNYIQSLTDPSHQFSVKYRLKNRIVEIFFASIHRGLLLVMRSDDESLYIYQGILANNNNNNNRKKEENNLFPFDFIRVVLPIQKYHKNYYQAYQQQLQLSAQSSSMEIIDQPIQLSGQKSQSKSEKGLNEGQYIYQNNNNNVSVNYKQTCFLIKDFVKDTPFIIVFPATSNKSKPLCIFQNKRNEVFIHNLSFFVENYQNACLIGEYLIVLSTASQINEQSTNSNINVSPFETNQENEKNHENQFQLSEIHQKINVYQFNQKFKNLVFTNNQIYQNIKLAENNQPRFIETMKTDKNSYLLLIMTTQKNTQKYEIHVFSFENMESKSKVQLSQQEVIYKVRVFDLYIKGRKVYYIGALILQQQKQTPFIQGSTSGSMAMGNAVYGDLTGAHNFYTQSQPHYNYPSQNSSQQQQQQQMQCKFYLYQFDDTKEDESNWLFSLVELDNQQQDQEVFADFTILVMGEGYGVQSERDDSSLVRFILIDNNNISIYKLSGQNKFTKCQNVQMPQFFDKLLITSIRSQKKFNYFICGDVLRGLQCYVYKETEGSQLQLVAEETTRMMVRDFVIFYYNFNLYALVCDEHKNLYFYSFKKDKDKDKLTIDKIADFHLGTKINKLVYDENAGVIIAAGADGNVYAIRLIEDEGLLLLKLQNEFIEELPFAAGLNPAEIRSINISKCDQRMKSRKSYIDINLLDQYFNVDRQLQNEVLNKFRNYKKDIFKVLENALSHNRQQQQQQQHLLNSQMNANTFN